MTTTRKKWKDVKKGDRVVLRIYAIGDKDILLKQTALEFCESVWVEMESGLDTADRLVFHDDAEVEVVEGAE